MEWLRRRWSVPAASSRKKNRARWFTLPVQIDSATENHRALTSEHPNPTSLFAGFQVLRDRKYFGDAIPIASRARNPQQLLDR